MTSSSHARDNLIVWEELKIRNPGIFRDLIEDGCELKLGRLIGEGGQAQILEASIKIDGITYESNFVAKVFKLEDFSLADLKRQWPVTTKEDPEAAGNGQFVSGKVVFSGSGLLFCSKIRWGTLLNDGRFAFVMKRYWGDLRTLINLRLGDNSEGPPFSHPEALEIMWDISRGMKHLHGNGVLHKDLKAANILIALFNNSDPRSGYQCQVADFESSVLVQGTGFWRAPEVLQELLKQPRDRSEDLWTEKVDAYSFAMTCYEVIEVIGNE